MDKLTKDGNNFHHNGGGQELNNGMDRVLTPEGNETIDVGNTTDKEDHEEVHEAKQRGRTLLSHFR